MSMTSDGKPATGAKSGATSEIKLEKSLFLNVGLPIW
jgi:hypothetical protein